jgi:FkbM family methyltransferase
VKLVAGREIPGPGAFQFDGLWYPDGEIITKALAHQLRGEAFYNCDRFQDAMKHVRRWRAAVECGAHVGHWSRALAPRFQRVLAIEAHPDTAACLARNLEPWPNAVAVHCALGAVTGRVAVGGRKGSLDREVQGMLDGPVPLRRLDDLPEVQALAAIDYMKVHVNGMEFAVLGGAVETLKRHRPVLTVVMKKALAHYQATQQDIFDLLMDRLGYRIVSRLKPYWVFA